MTEIKQRDEGGILDWSMLDDEQRAAGLKAHQLFVAMADRPEDKTPQGSELFSFLPRLDAYRGNHTILIDGTRGSGKTAVMLRLLQDWSETLKGEPESSREKATASDAKRPEKPLDDFKPEAGARLVPVGLLDLEAVPHAANLATRIAGMFERVVSAMERRGTKSDRTTSAPSWALLENDTLTSRDKWQHFVGAAALEWDRSLERRRATIDPEAYAIEVEQAERKGLHAPKCFREFIDALVRDWKEWPPQRGMRPFFIVPIDDADLNPARVVELFGLLRTLWHPRVGYLLTGDSGLFMHVLTTHFRSQIDMPQLSGPTTLGAFRVQLMPDEGRQAERLARDYYQKAVSLENCLKLQPISGGARLDFIRDALSHIKQAPLLDYLDVDSISPLALPDRWRKLKDLRDLVRSNKTHTANDFALHVWNDALDDSSLLGNELSSLRGPKRRHDDVKTRASKTLLVHPDSDSSKSWPGDVTRLQVWLGLRYRGGLGTSHVPFDPGWSYGGGLTSRELLLLDDSIVAARLLRMNLDGYSCGGPTLAVSTFLKVPSAVLKLPWMGPGADRPYKIQLLLRAWNERAPDIGGDVVELAKMFLSTVLSVWEWHHGNSLSWHEIATVLVDRFFLKADGAENRWFASAALLAAPEWGLPSQGANVWLEALKSRAIAVNSWELFRKEMLDCRRRTISSHLMTSRQETEGSVLDDLIDEIDAQVSDYDWRRVMKASTP